jgi:hypothetical protein
MHYAILVFLFIWALEASSRAPQPRRRRGR